MVNLNPRFAKGELNGQGEVALFADFQTVVRAKLQGIFLTQVIKLHAPVRQHFDPQLIAGNVIIIDLQAGNAALRSPAQFQWSGGMQELLVLLFGGDGNFEHGERPRTGVRAGGRTQ